MALQTSGAISLLDIQNEFGGLIPISLSEYYLNGAYVTSNNSSSVPTSGTISLNSFYGTTSAFNYTETISQNTGHYMLREKLIDAGWNLITPVIADITVAAGVYVGGVNTTGVARSYTSRSYQDNGWVSFLKTYGSWENSEEYTSASDMRWMVYIAQSGNYLIEMSVDDNGRLYIDGSQVLTSASWSSIASTTTFLTKGWHTVQLSSTDTSTYPMAAAAQIRTGGTVIWNTRSNFTDAVHKNGWNRQGGLEITNDGISFPAGSQITLKNYGVIAGYGGFGGDGSYGGQTSTLSAGNGGTGLLAHGAPVTVINYGTIAGGGGGGRGSLGTYQPPGSSPKELGIDVRGGGGGGGRCGHGWSIGGVGGYQGKFGSATSAGKGGQNSYGQIGGAGGDWGQAGAAANTGTASGGSPGPAVNGTEYITWGQTGTRIGALMATTDFWF